MNLPNDGLTDDKTDTTQICLYIFTLNRLGLIVFVDCRDSESSVFIRSNIVWNQWERTLKARSIRMSLNHGTANYANTIYFIRQGKYSNQSHGVCLR